MYVGEALIQIPIKTDCLLPDLRFTIGENYDFLSMRVVWNSLA